MRGAILTAAGLVIAGLVEAARAAGWFAQDSTYAHPDLPLVIAAVSFSALFTGLESTKLSTASRDLTLSRVTAIDLAGQFVGLVAMVCWALASSTIWALIVGVVIVGPFRAVLTHVALPGLSNRWMWDVASAREIRSFANWIMLSSTLGFLVISGDRLVLAWLLDAGALGQYAVALTIVGSIQLVFVSIIGNVVFPALSETYRTQPHRLKENFYRMRTPLDIALLVMLGFLFSAGSGIAHVLYDDRYALTGPLIEILAVSLFAVRYDVATQCYLAMGKSRLLPGIVIVRLLPLLLLTPVAFHYWGGLSAAAWTIALAPLAGVPVHLYLMWKNGFLDLRREFIVLPCVVPGLIAGWSFMRLLEYFA